MYIYGMVSGYGMVQQDKRYERAKLIAKRMHINEFAEQRGKWLVQSETNPERRYLVTPDYCTCLDFQNRATEQFACKHMLAVAIKETRVT